VIETVAGLLYERGGELARSMVDALAGVGRRPRIAVINGIPHASLGQLEALGDLVVQQTRRDICLDLQRAGHTIRRHLREGPFDLVLVLAGRQREQTMGWLASGAALLAGSQAGRGGTLALCSANDMGAKGYERRLGDLGAALKVSSKSKCRLVVFNGDSIACPGVLQDWLAAAAPRKLADSGLISCPGVFSWEHPDAGSRLLLQHLPTGLSGRGMDLGCGNGYLSCHVLARHAGMREWHAVDVDAVAVECARQNLQAAQAACSVHVHWLDATREGLPGNMDVVLLNPPFHRDKADLVSLGQAMILAAQRSMHQAGNLFLVANRHLPYELLLYQSFEQVSCLFEGEGYKVMRCDGVAR